MVSSVVELLKCRADDHHNHGLDPLAPYCCVLAKDTLRHFSLFGGLSKQL